MELTCCSTSMHYISNSSSGSFCTLPLCRILPIQAARHCLPKALRAPRTSVWGTCTRAYPSPLCSRLVGGQIYPSSAALHDKLLLLGLLH